MGAPKRKKKQVSQDSTQNPQAQVAENRAELNPAIVSAEKNDSHEVINAPEVTLSETSVAKLDKENAERIAAKAAANAKEGTPASAVPVRTYAVSGEARGSVYAQPNPVESSPAVQEAVPDATSATPIVQAKPIQGEAVQEGTPEKSYLEKTAQERFRAASQGKDYIAQVLLANQRRIAEAEAENEAETELEQKRAAWTGAGELAVGLVNLFGVGQLGASNQTYHSYSRDWQAQAERNARQRRSRIDNLQARQDSIRMQRQQLLERRLSELLAAERQDQYRAEQAEQRQAEQEALAQHRADELEQRGKEQESLAAYRKDSHDEAVRHNKAMEDNSRDKAKMEAGIKLARYGLKEDDNGQIVVDNDSIITKTAATGGKPTGRGKNRFYYTDDDGELAPIYMTTAEYKAILDQVYALYSGDKEFRNSYNTAPDDSARRSILWSYAIQAPEIRAQLKLYEDENYKADEQKSSETQSKSETPKPSTLEEVVADAGLSTKSMMPEEEKTGMEVYDKYK